MAEQLLRGRAIHWSPIARDIGPHALSHAWAAPDASAAKLRTLPGSFLFLWIGLAKFRIPAETLERFSNPATTGFPLRRVTTVPDSI
ncbi:MAG: hypothetical protein IPH26_12215 [Sterolibacteriaceae bacterium]|uniref:Uncharacterized protein n=1 Tax=Candidatus Methylophosphatis roskildensis TaxID=2899263 RepID=A0A9D7HUG4_9PROT|nr:hypothetical protein [Candidatus Methylophosphatis roskildensis]MBK7236129.1 hypothetical protein [Sterolibacteriaceae bacterium]